MIYFIRCGDSGPVKIGHTKSLEARLPFLQTAHWEQLHLLRTIDGGARQEAWLHKFFRSLWIRGEWHRYDAQMLTIELPTDLPTVQRITALDPAKGVIERLGGVGRVAKITGHNRCNVHRWTYPVDRGGTGGLIPQKHHAPLIAAAKSLGIKLRQRDLWPRIAA